MSDVDPVVRVVATVLLLVVFLVSKPTMGSHALMSKLSAVIGKNKLLAAAAAGGATCGRMRAWMGQLNAEV